MNSGWWVSCEFPFEKLPSHVSVAHSRNTFRVGQKKLFVWRNKTRSETEASWFDVLSLTTSSRRGRSEPLRFQHFSSLSCPPIQEKSLKILWWVLAFEDSHIHWYRPWPMLRLGLFASGVLAGEAAATLKPRQRAKLQLSNLLTVSCTVSALCCWNTQRDAVNLLKWGKKKSKREAVFWSKLPNVEKNLLLASQLVTVSSY